MAAAAWLDKSTTCNGLAPRADDLAQRVGDLGRDVDLHDGELTTWNGNPQTSGTTSVCAMKSRSLAAAAWHGESQTSSATLICAMRSRSCAATAWPDELAIGHGEAETSGVALNCTLKSCSIAAAAGLNELTTWHDEADRGRDVDLHAEVLLDCCNGLAQRAEDLAQRIEDLGHEVDLHADVLLQRCDALAQRSDDLLFLFSLLDPLRLVHTVQRECCTADTARFTAEQRQRLHRHNAQCAVLHRVHCLHASACTTSLNPSDTLVVNLRACVLRLSIARQQPVRGCWRERSRLFCFCLGSYQDNNAVVFVICFRHAWIHSSWYTLHNASAVQRTPPDSLQIGQRLHRHTAQFLQHAGCDRQHTTEPRLPQHIGYDRRLRGRTALPQPYAVPDSTKGATDSEDRVSCAACPRNNFSEAVPGRP